MVRDEDGVEQTLRVTEEHPFFVRSGGWTPAKSLASRDTLLGAEGTLTVVANEHEAHPQGVTVYNLEVERAHTYFVLAEGANDAAAVWVHNATKVYRGLAATDDISQGLSARAPNAGNSVISHVAGRRQSQWISTTANESIARAKWGEHGVVEIGLSKISSEVVDLTDGIPGMERTMMSNWARRMQEVLVKNHIPATAIRKLGE